MSFKKLGRIFCGLAMAAAISAAAALSGCTIETKHPRAVITIEFNGEEYAIEYTLYRNMYPQTVRHFIELAEEGFYDNTIIHDYASNDWYGGGYDYDEDEYEVAITAEDIASYFNGETDGDIATNKESEYIELYDAGKLTTSVYTGYEFDGDDMVVDESTAHYTLRGEFSNNGHVIDNGELSAAFGALKMYYTDKVYETDEAEAESVVYLKTSNNETVQGLYQYNSATSLFAIQVGSSSSLSDSSYCTFAQLRNDDAEETLEELLEAIEDYIDDYLNGEDDDFVQESDVVYIDKEINKGTTAASGTTTDYSVPVVPIIIKSVKITRY